MHISERVRQLLPALMDEVKTRMAALRRAGVRVINLGQAIPDIAPSPALLAAARQALEEPDTHIYSPDAGLPALRAALAADLAAQNGLRCDPETEVLITAGANQAFLTAMLTLLDPGERVLLPAPFFFNHEMAVRLAGGVPVSVPLSEESGFALRLENLRPYLDPPPRALVLVTPNNPTGAVYDPDELVVIGREAAARGIAVVTDETYRHFLYEGARHLSLAALPDMREQVITIGSFSKAYGMTGWRVGYMVAGAEFIAQALKVQDTMVICAPVIAQKAALGALRESSHYLADRLAVLERRRRLLAEELARIPGLSWRPARGAFFAFVRVAGCRDSPATALAVLEEAHVATIPGSLFGPAGEGFLRLSYGAAGLEDLAEACRRLARFFAGRPGEG